MFVFWFVEGIYKTDCFSTRWEITSCYHDVIIDVITGFTFCTFVNKYHIVMYPLLRKM